MMAAEQTNERSVADVCRAILALKTEWRLEVPERSDFESSKDYGVALAEMIEQLDAMPPKKADEDDQGRLPADLLKVAHTNYGRLRDAEDYARQVLAKIEGQDVDEWQQPFPLAHLAQQHARRRHLVLPHRSPRPSRQLRPDASRGSLHDRPVGSVGVTAYQRRCRQHDVHGRLARDRCQRSAIARRRHAFPQRHGQLVGLGSLCDDQELGSAVERRFARHRDEACRRAGAQRGRPGRFG